MATVEKYTKFFMCKDVNGDGELTPAELKDALKGSGYTRGQIEAIFNTADTSGDNKMSLEEFLVCMGAVDPKVHHSAAMLAVCRSFDLNGDGNIDKEELKAAIDECRSKDNMVTEEEAEMLMAKVDQNDDGQVTYKELLKEVFGYNLED